MLIVNLTIWEGSTGISNNRHNLIMFIRRAEIQSLFVIGCYIQRGKISLIPLAKGIYYKRSYYIDVITLC